MTAEVVAQALLSGLLMGCVYALIAAGLSPQWGGNLFKAMETMTAFIAATAKGDIATGSVTYKTIFAAGMTLFVLTFAMNFVSIRFVRKYRQIYE